MKIAKKISLCSDCQYFVNINAPNNTRYGICDFQELNEENDEVVRERQVVLIKEKESLHHFKLEIPEDCPLEDYKPSHK